MTNKSNLLLLGLLMMCIRETRSAQEPAGSNKKGPQGGPKASLEINGAFTLTSEPIPVTTASRESCLGLFRSEQVRDLLISGGGSQHLEHQRMSPEYLELWNGICNSIPQAHRPSKEDALLVTEIEVKFPGLRVVTSSLTGVKLVENVDTGLPEYEYCLLAQKQQPHGLPLAVRLFQQVTGNANRPKDQFSPSTGLSLSRVSLVEESSGEPNAPLVLLFDSWLLLKYSFPAFLLRIFPFSKKRVENILSRSVIKMARKEVKKGVVVAHKILSEHMFDDQLEQQPSQPTEL